LAAEGDADDAVFEREAGVIDGVVFNPQLADAQTFSEAIGFDERREAHLQTDGRAFSHGQQLAITPHRFGARLDRLAGERALDAIVIVNDFEGPKIELADVSGGQWILAAALAALERSHKIFVLFHDIKPTKNLCSRTK